VPNLDEEPPMGLKKEQWIDAEEFRESPPAKKSAKGRR